MSPIFLFPPLWERPKENIFQGQQHSKDSQEKRPEAAFAASYDIPGATIIQI